MDENLAFSYFSSRLQEITGLDPARYLGKTRADLTDLRENPEAWGAHLEDLAAHRSFKDFVYPFVDPATKKYRWVKISGKPHFDPAGRFKGYRGVGEEITERYLEDAWIRKQALSDHLTGLANRAGLQEQVEKAIAQIDGTGDRLVLQMIDLDRFKDINDHFGHEAGDLVLKHVATMVRDKCSRCMCAARLGGDEFAVVFRTDNIRELRGYLQEQWRQSGAFSLPLQEHTLDIRLSAGVAIYPDQASDFGELLRFADLALYHSKRSGRGISTTFNQSMSAELENRLTTKAAFRRGLASDQIVPFYQPVVDIIEGEVIGFEALMRWRHPQKGLLAPGAFPQVMKDQELLMLIGDQMLELVTADMRRWSEAGLAFGWVGINFSSCNMRGDETIFNITNRLDDCGLTPEQLLIEITEDAILLDDSASSGGNIAELQRLADLGIRIALDDFGMGNASLSHLRSVPASNVKIDKSFVWELAENADSRAIVNAIVSLGRALGYKTVAEGVESLRQLHLLREMGCRHAQGYLLARPMPAREVPGFLASFSGDELLQYRPNAAPQNRMSGAT